MAGATSTITYDDGHDGKGSTGSIRKILIDWTSDDTTGAVTVTTRKISGELLKAVTDPGAAAPTADYDITITDEEGANVLANCHDDLADRHTSTTQTVDFFLSGAANVGARPVVCDALSVAITNAGNSKQGQIAIYYR
jgi:hypothetical protein